MCQKMNEIFSFPYMLISEQNIKGYITMQVSVGPSSEYVIWTKVFLEFEREGSH